MRSVPRPLVGADAGALRRVSAKDMGVRFAFGAAISVVAGLAGHLFGARVGGALLAFPAILPATLTLLERKDGTGAAVRDIGGAVLGGVGLIGFALVASSTLGLLPAPVALVVALGAWLTLSFALYVARTAGVVPFLRLQEDVDTDGHGGGPPTGTGDGGGSPAPAGPPGTGSDHRSHQRQEAGPTGPASPASAGHRAEEPRPRPPHPLVPNA